MRIQYLVHIFDGIVQLRANPANDEIAEWLRPEQYKGRAILSDAVGLG